MKVCVVTFGCKVNWCESESIYRTLDVHGYTRSHDALDADIVVFNSCAVTSEGVAKLRRYFRKVKSLNPVAVTALVGCVPQAFPFDLEGFEDAEIILGNFNKNNFGFYLNSFLMDPFRRRIRDIPQHNQDQFEKFDVNTKSDRVRAFLKIEDGCNRFCSYCVIPYARGRVRSKPLSDIIQEVENFAENGYKEVVLVGVNLSCYGADINSSLEEAVKGVNRVQGIERIRLSSLEPDLVTDEMLEGFLEIGEKFCPNFHLSLQSGSDKILKLMKRKYSRVQYLEIVNKIRKMFKNAQITTDVIVGFPGETEEDFKETLQIIKEIGFLKVHVFPYSERSGTQAAKMSGQIPKSVKHERVRAALDESHKQTEAIINHYCETVWDVLYEKRKPNELFEGYTKNYIPVAVESLQNIEGKILLTRIVKYESGTCFGKLE